MIDKIDRELFKSAVTVAAMVAPDEYDVATVYYKITTDTALTTVDICLSDLCVYLGRASNYLKVKDERLLNKLYKILLDREDMIWRSEDCVLETTKDELVAPIIISDNAEIDFELALKEKKIVPDIISSAYKKYRPEFKTSLADELQKLNYHISKIQMHHNIHLITTMSGEVVAVEK